MSWDYAELSKLAKKNGGPEGLLKIVKAAARRTGRNEMKPFIVIAFAAGALACAGIQKVAGIIGDRQKRAEEEAAAAEVKLIAGIRDYDKSHTDVEDDEGECEDPHNEEKEEREDSSDEKEEDEGKDEELHNVEEECE